MLRYIYTFILSASLSIALAQPPHPKLRTEIARIAHNSGGKLGVAIKLLETNDTLSYQNENKYVMQSVFKFPIAMALLHEVDHRRLNLNQHVQLKMSDYFTASSQLRDKYPQANVNITIRELLAFMIVVSDNIACDVLLRQLGGPAKINDYVHNLGHKDIVIKVSEKQMHESWSAQYQNWTKPSTQINLLEKLYRGNTLSKSSSDLLMKLMLQTSVSTKRLKGLLPPNTPVAHRSGTSDTNDQNLSAATNDVGMITLPNGNHLAIAVLLTDAVADTESRERTIAEVARAAYDEFAQ